MTSCIQTYGGLRMIYRVRLQGTQSFFLRALVSFGTVRNPSIKNVFQHSSYLGVFYCTEKLITVYLVLWCYAAAFMLCNLPVIKTLLAYSIGYA